MGIADSDPFNPVSFLFGLLYEEMILGDSHHVTSKQKT